MDLRGRIREIERRLSTIETVSRLRSASISEGVTEFTEDGSLTVEDGGAFIIDDGGAIGGGSWEIGANPDGTTYANIGDALLYTHSGDPVTEYITTGSVPTVIASPITHVTYPLPAGATSAIVMGSVTVMSMDNLKTILRIRSDSLDISLVVPEGETISVPVMMNFTGNIDYEIHVTECFDVDVSFESIYNWTV